MAKRWKRFLWEVSMIVMVGGGCAAILNEQETTPSVPHYDPTRTPTPTEAGDIRIEFVDDVPVAYINETCTNTPTMPPTPTERQQEHIATPVPTNTPTPTKKASIVPYPTGYPHSRKVEDAEAHTCKPYTAYTAYTKKNSAQHKLQQIAHTASNGLRIVTDPNGVERYCIALAPQWAGGQVVDIGRCIDIKMANGETLHCVLGDCKKHEHTQGKQGYYGSNGELIEFIAEQAALPDKVRNGGDVSALGGAFAGAAKSVTVLELYIDGFGGW